MTTDSDWLVPPDAALLTGNEQIAGLGSTVRDFWQFALGDLRMNNARGYLAEFIVAKALGLDKIRRVEWDAYDILFCEITVEVKSSAYLQSWDQRKQSAIQFSGLKGTRWHPRGGLDPAGKRFNAMVYVFCVHTAREHEMYDQLQLDQWMFFVLPRHELEALDQKGIGIATVSRLSGGPTEWSKLQAAVSAAAVGQERESDHAVWWE